MGVSQAIALIVWILVIVFIIWVVVSCIVVVPQANAYIVEFFGSYRKTWEHGLHLKIPFAERISSRVSLKEQVCDFAPSSVITKDNVTMKIDTVVYFKIFDPKLYAYGVDRPISALENLNATTLRNIIGGMELDQTLTSRDTINAEMQQILDVATDPWGIKVTRVELKNIIPPAEIQNAMEKQMKAEREKRQTILEASAHRESVVARAEGDKQAKILAAEAERDSQIALAEGRAKSIELVYNAEAAGLEALKNARINDSVLKLKGLEALKDVSDGRATKIFMPTDLSGIISTLGVLSEATGLGDATPIDRSPRPAPAAAFDPCCENGTKSPETQGDILTAQQISNEIAATSRREETQ
ncbi:MAG TPA: SPFH domain-containing protein [Lachnospiraceae bacterium]|nr:SPFH domain-containing protein [Lachnospiraceae bacterium]